MDVSGAAYVRNGRLCIVGVHESDAGPIPFTVTEDVGEGIEDGPVDFGVEDSPVSTAIQKASHKMVSKIEDEKMRKIAGEWVDRARAGDQNAMALLQGVRRNVQAGSERAKRAAAHIARYIKAHPVDLTEGRKYLPAPPPVPEYRSVLKKLSQYVADPAAVCAWTPPISRTDPYVAALVLANGPNLSPDHIKAVASHFGEDERRDFWMGFRNWRDKSQPSSDAHSAGRAVGTARVLQGVRLKVYPISYFCELSGWELGD